MLLSESQQLASVQFCVTKSTLKRYKEVEMNTDELTLTVHRQNNVNSKAKGTDPSSVVSVLKWKLCEAVGERFQ